MKKFGVSASTEKNSSRFALSLAVMTAEKLRDFHQTQLNLVMKFYDQFDTEKRCVILKLCASRLET